MKLYATAVVMLIILFCGSTGYSGLTINTNQLKTNNITIITNQQDILITNDMIYSTNNVLKNVIEPELPNSYLSTGKIEYPVPETIARRFDVVFFIAAPTSFVLTLNIMIIINNYFNNSRPLDNNDWIYIYLNTLIIPLTVAYYDHVYMDDQKLLKEKYADINENKKIIDRFRLDIPVYSFRF